jgi:hypothetical protein
MRPHYIRNTCIHTDAGVCSHATEQGTRNPTDEYPSGQLARDHLLATQLQVYDRVKEDTLSHLDLQGWPPHISRIYKGVAVLRMPIRGRDGDTYLQTSRFWQSFCRSVSLYKGLFY